jgi:hypothetical protein
VLFTFKPCVDQICVIVKLICHHFVNYLSFAVKRTTILWLSKKKLTYTSQGMIHMGSSNHCIFFIEDKKFLPTKQHILDIADVFLDAGVINSDERIKLGNKIDMEFIDSEKPVAFRDNSEVIIRYNLAGPNCFPIFDSRDGGPKKSNNFRLFRKAIGLDMNAVVRTRFIIAETGEDTGNVAYRGEVQDIIDNNPVIYILISRIVKILGTRIKIGTFYV